MVLKVNQSELFNTLEYVDLSHSMTARSTRRKRRSVPAKNPDRLNSPIKSKGLPKIMTQFTSSAKPLTYYVETKSILSLCAKFGYKLTGLTQEDKYQLCTAISLFLWGVCESGIGEAADNPNDDEIDLIEAGDGEIDLIEASAAQLNPALHENVTAAMVLLQYDAPEILSQLLPVIAEYARDDDR
jgi:hypothetical protein